MQVLADLLNMDTPYDLEEFPTRNAKAVLEDEKFGHTCPPPTEKELQVKLIAGEKNYKQGSSSTKP